MGIFAYMKRKKLEHLDEKTVPAVLFKRVKSEIKKLGHEHIHFLYDKKTNLRAIVAIHNTARGPGVGGFRCWSYRTEWDAINDALRLSRGMTFKNACVGLNIGGGKAVAWLGKKTKPLLKAYARLLAAYVPNDQYITAEDVGTTVEDMDTIDVELKKRKGKKYVGVLCCSIKRGCSGNPSPYTAIGVYEGMKLLAKEILGKRSLKGVRIAIQGLGNVGWSLFKMLVKDGAQLTVTARTQKSIDRAVKYPNVTGVSKEKIYDADVDIFSPCALGGVLNQKTIPRLKCKIIAGSANNQLEDEIRDGDRLRKRGIVYAPDFMINAGGVINAYIGYLSRTNTQRYSPQKTVRKIKEISKNLITVYLLSKKRSISTSEGALVLARKRLGRS